MQHDDIIHAMLDIIQETSGVLLSAIDLGVQFAVHYSSSSKMNQLQVYCDY